MTIETKRLMGLSIFQSAFIVLLSTANLWFNYSEVKFIENCQQQHKAHVYVGLDNDDNRVLYCETQDGTVLATRG